MTGNSFFGLHPLRQAVSLVLLLALCTFANADEIVWHDGTEFDVEGKGWNETASTYDRLPQLAQAKVTPAVWGLSKDSAGIAIRFQTNSPVLHVRWSLTKARLDMPHMPATGVSGVDLYARNEKGEWRFVGNGTPTTVEGNSAVMHFPTLTSPTRECLLYLPLYNGTKSIEVGVPATAQIEKAPARPEANRKPIVVYGTSIAQGGCASRPGLAWPAILGRLLDRPIINLGFSGSGLMEPDTTEVIAEIDAEAFVADCIWNIGGNESAYQTNVPALVQAVRKEQGAKPIFFVGQSHIQEGVHPTQSTQWQEEAVLKLIGQGDENLFLIPGSFLMGDDGEGTVDGVHPNDLGMERQARAMLPFILSVVRPE